MEKFVVVDLETTGHASGKRDKIIEVGIVTIIDGQITEQYTTFLDPGIKIPPFISGLTGIHDEDVADAPVFASVAKDIIEKFSDAYLIAHNVPFDLGFLNAELAACGYEKLRCPVIDTVELSRILHPQAPSYKLSQISAYLDIYHDAPHRALSDAYVTARLFIELKKELCALPLETLKQLKKLEKSLKSDLAALLDQQIEHLKQAPMERKDLQAMGGLAFKKISIPEHSGSPIGAAYGDFLDELFADEARLAEGFGIYEKRPGQKQMAETIYDAFQSKQHALIEAETGTGKTFGYLLPAVYEALKQKEPIVISTYTTQLQTQLLEEEIPLLQKIMPVSFHAALLKGKYHYVSLERLSSELRQQEIGNYDIVLTKAIMLVWLTETETGDIDEIQLPSNGYHFYRKISAEAEEDVNPRSPWYEHSYYQIARRKADQAELVITNHALLCADIFSEAQLLPAYQRCIIDEGHQFEKAAAKRFGLKLDYVQMQFVLNRIGASDEKAWMEKHLSSMPFSGMEWDRRYKDFRHELDQLFRYIFSFVSTKKGRGYTDTGRIQCRLMPNAESDHAYTVMKEMANRAIFGLQDLISLLNQMKAHEQYALTEEALQFAEQLQSFKAALDYLFQTMAPNDVKWAEIEAKGAKNAVYLYSEPASVAETLHAQFFSKKESVVLTSATLTVRHSFRFIQEQLGLEQEALLTQKLPSPFRYHDQVQLLIPTDFPDVREPGDAFIYSICEAILSLAEITEGRMLVLFTSFDMLKKCHDLLKEYIVDETYVLIAQGITSGSRARLKKNFQSYDKAILFGTSSFWEGIDIPGEDLSAVVIARLPFQPPNHPVYEAKANRLQAAGRNPFYELSLPNAVIRFKQGFGRLIRSSRDRGIVFVCDARLTQERYGSYFMESIPEVPVTVDSTSKLMDKAKNWF